MEVFAAMASSFRRLSSLLVFVGFLSLLRPCACYNRMNSSDTDLAMSPAVATWYGDAEGPGSTGNVYNVPALRSEVCMRAYVK